jgi:putative transposase
MKDGCKQGNTNLPMFGKVKVVLHRPIPKGFKIKLYSVTKKADGFYVTLSLEDQTVPEIKPDFNPDKITGIDVGLKEFLTTFVGQPLLFLNIISQSSKTFTGNSKCVSRRKRGNRRQKAVKQLGCQHKKIADKRKDFTSKQRIGCYQNMT